MKREEYICDFCGEPGASFMRKGFFYEKFYPPGLEALCDVEIICNVSVCGHKRRLDLHPHCEAPIVLCVLKDCIKILEKQMKTKEEKK